MSLLSIFFYRNYGITEHEILTAVYDQRFTGLLMVDLTTPPELKASFKKMNCGTIFDHVIVTESMVKSKMLAACKLRGTKTSYHIAVKQLIISD